MDNKFIPKKSLDNTSSKPHKSPRYYWYDWNKLLANEPCAIIHSNEFQKKIKIAAKKNVNKKDIVSPGHVFPIIAKDGGVLVRAGHTEASVDISKLAKKNNSAVICEIMNEDGSMAKGQDLFDFANKHKLKIGKIEDLISYRLKKEKLVKLKKSSEIKVKNQTYKIKIYEKKWKGW